MQHISIFLVDDHRVFIDALTLLLGSVGIEVVGTASNGARACDYLRNRANRADIAVMDVNMPVMDGLTATDILKKARPELRVLLLSMNSTPTLIRQAITAGANGYMLKNSSRNEFIEAIGAIMRGDIYLCPNAVNAIMQALHAPAPQATTTPLTEREIEVVRYVVQEYSNAKISEALQIDIRTVESHRRNIMRKLDINNSIALVKYAINQGWV